MHGLCSLCFQVTDLQYLHVLRWVLEDRQLVFKAANYRDESRDGWMNCRQALRFICHDLEPLPELLSSTDTTGRRIGNDPSHFHHDDAVNELQGSWNVMLHDNHAY